MASSLDEISQAHRRIAELAAAFAIAIGSSVLVGWTLNDTAFNSVLPGLVAMQPTTAISLVVSGSTILAASAHPKFVTIQIVLGSILFLLALQTLAQYIFGIDIGTDYLFFSNEVLDQPVAMDHPGRMAEPTAMAFVLIAISIMLVRSRRPEMVRLFSICATAVLVLVIAILLGYLFRVGPLTEVFGFSNVALNTAAGLGALSVGILALRPEVGWVSLIRGDRVGASAARRLLPLVIVVPVAVAWLAFRGSEAGLYPTEIRLAIITTVTLLLLVSVTIWAATRLNGLDSIRRTEHALLATETQARAVIEASPDAFVRLDENGIVTEWSGQAEALFGWTREEAIGNLLADMIIPDELRRAHEAGLARHRDVPSHPHLDMRTQVEARNRHGDMFPVELTVVSTMWEGRTIFNGFVRDIRERLASEGRLRHAQKMEAVGRLTGGVAHDFNNLLAITIGNLDLLEEHAGLDADAKELVAAAQDATLRGADLTGRLLSFSRQQTLQPHSTDINALITEYTKLLERLLGADIDFRLNLEGGLGKARVDRGQLEAAITNLATNARDAMPKGGQLTISTRSETIDGTYAAKYPDVTIGDYIAVEVTDTGHGMSAQVRERAIEPFYTTKEEGKGTGLGLSMVFGFAKQSDGHVRIYSEINQGTTVTILLPRASVTTGDQETVTLDSPEAMPGESILLVEDDPSLRRVAAVQLRSLGYRVVEAEDGRAAWELLTQDSEIHLLLTDIVMPGGLSGVDLGRKARILRPSIRIIYMSGFPQSAFGDRTHLDPGVVLMRKPFRKAEIALQVRKALSKRS